MGYRSNIRIRLRKEDYERLVKEFEADEKVKLSGGGNLFKELDKFVEQKNYEYYDYDRDNTPIVKKANVVYFGWNWLKWYDSYEDVQFIMNYLESHNNMPYAFTRVGESMDGDIEYRNYAFDNIYTMIDFDDDCEGM